MTTALLLEFLEARITEDENAATRAALHNGRNVYDNDNDDSGWLLVQPARVLAECLAKRRRIHDFNVLDGDDQVSHDPITEARRRQALVAISYDAGVYAHHPDYQTAWRH